MSLCLAMDCIEFVIYVPHCIYKAQHTRRVHDKKKKSNYWTISFDRERLAEEWNQ